MLDGAAPLPEAEARDTLATTDARARCPDCGERLAHRNGCVECWTCGYSSCG